MLPTQAKPGGALGARAPPRADKKILGAKFTGESAPPARECTPEAEQESNFFDEIWEIWAVGEVI